MNISYLLIGGNEGDKRGYLSRARRLIADAGAEILQTSALYETAAWGKTDQPSFLNQALRIRTLLDALPLMQTLLEIETTMGRVRSEKYGSRRIDIDMLFFNETIIGLPELTIPHPELHNRRFALTPMAEIAPDYIHPLLHRSIKDLLSACTDPLEVNIIN